MQIALIGNTGSGKSTVGRLLAKRHHLPYIGTGNIARQLAQENPETMLQLEQGLFAPEGAIRERTRHLLEQAMVQHGGYVLDGFPRKVEQVCALAIWLQSEPQYFHIDLNPYACLLRLVKRARPDDLNPDSLARRLQSFEDHTKPVIRLLESDYSITRIDGALEPETIADYIDSCTKTP